SNLLGRRREIAELQDSVETLKEQLETLQGQLETFREKRNHFRQEAASIQEQLQQEFLRENTVGMNLNAMSERREEIKTGYQALKKESEQLEQQVQEIQENRQSIQLELEVSGTQEKALESQIQECQELLENKKKTEEQLSETLEQGHLEMANLTSKHGFAVENLKRIRDELESLEQQRESLESGMVQGLEEVENKEQEILQIQKEIQLEQVEMEKEETLLQEALLAKEEMNQKYKAFFAKRDELSGRMNLLDKECFRLNGQKEKLEESKESQINYMWEEYEVTYGQVQHLSQEEDRNPAELKKQISQTRSEIRQLGNVNVNAIDEYKEVLERQTFMQTQHDDLVKAEETLLDIIQELDTGMRRQFEEKFAEIRKEFDKAFKELFGGGKGTLELEEDVDILEAGIRI
ncbi:condensin subunit Smc, partial [gut metagenome]